MRNEGIHRPRAAQPQADRGGLRQAGFLAAAGLIAMNQMSLRLGEDHANAKTLAAMLEELDGVAVARISWISIWSF